MTLCVPCCTYFPLLPLLIEPIQIIFASDNYEAAKMWLLEDEYERLNNRILQQDADDED
jgi:hypothetical protein